MVLELFSQVLVPLDESVVHVIERNPDLIFIESHDAIEYLHGPRL